MARGRERHNPVLPTIGRTMPHPGVVQAAGTVPPGCSTPVAAPRLKANRNGEDKMELIVTLHAKYTASTAASPSRSTSGTERRAVSTGPRQRHPSPRMECNS